MTEQAFKSARPAVAGLAAVVAAIASPPAAAVEEILVTARRVEENIQEIPVAVTAFQPEKLQQLNIQTIDEVARFTPGFSFNSAFGRQPGSDRPAIRGVTQILNGIGNVGSAAYFIDGIYLGGSPQSTELTNLERIEVIKGPQSAQFGRGTYAGAISYITKRPSLDDVEGGVTLTGAEFDTYNGAAWITAPIVEDKLGFLLSAGYNTANGAFDNRFVLDGVAAGDTLGGTEDTNATAKLLWTPVAGLEITLKGGFQRTDDEHPAFYLQGVDTLNCLKLRGGPGSGIAPRNRGYFCGEAQPNWDRTTIATSLFSAVGVEPGTRLDRNLGTLTVSYTDEKTRLNFSSLTGYVEDEVNTAFDVSYAGVNPVPVGGQNGAFFQIDRDDNTIFTQEFRVTTDQSRRLRGTAGVYFFRQQARELLNQRVAPDPAAGVGTSPPATVVGGPFNATAADLVGRRAPSCLAGVGCQILPQANAVNLTNSRIRNVALFGGVEYDFTDRLTGTVEARYAQDQIWQRNVLNDLSDLDGPVLEETFSAVTPRVSLRYQLTDDVNVYASVAGGTKPGTFNPTVPELSPGVPDESFRAVDEEKLIAYEVGAKTQWWDRRITANVAVYFNKIDDQQLTQNIEVNNQPQSLIVNAGKTEVWGAELETDFQLTDNWNLGLIYAYTDSEITERLSTDEADLLGWDGDPATYAQFADVSGQTSPRIPENQFAAFTRYEIPFNWGALYAGADVTYEDSRFAQEDNLIETGARTVVGARLGARFENWDLQVFVRNLTDDDTPVDILRYIDTRAGSLTSCTNVVNGSTLANPPTTAVRCAGNPSSSPRAFALSPQLPRQYGATLSYRFGGDR
jgi:outer membrane receptor protein involved in Fe transport